MAGQSIAVMFPALILSERRGIFNVWLHRLSIFCRGPVRPGLFPRCRCDVVQRQSVRGCDSMSLNDVDYGQLAGAVEHIQNLLTIFEEWFEESHKANDLDRSHTRDEIAFLWEASPRYNSLLGAAMCDITGLKDQLNELTDKQIAAMEAANR